MTEEEAATQDCIGPENCGKQLYLESRAMPIPSRRVCKGSACGMAWRWLDHGGPLLDGYCGLAGKP